MTFFHLNTHFMFTHGGENYQKSPITSTTSNTKLIHMPEFVSPVKCIRIMLNAKLMLMPESVSLVKFIQVGAQDDEHYDHSYNVYVCATSCILSEMHAIM